MIEGAIVGVFLMLLVFGTIDFTGAYWRCQGMQYAAEAGAEFAALRGAGVPNVAAVGPGPNDPLVETKVKASVPGFDPAKVKVTSEWPDGNEPGDEVIVTAVHPLPLTVARVFFPSGCGAPKPECTGRSVRRILRH